MLLLIHDLFESFSEKIWTEINGKKRSDYGVDMVAEIEILLVDTEILCSISE